MMRGILSLFLGGAVNNEDGTTLIHRKRSPFPLKKGEGMKKEDVCNRYAPRKISPLGGLSALLGRNDKSTRPRLSPPPVHPNVTTRTGKEILRRFAPRDDRRGIVIARAKNFQKNILTICAQ